MRKLSVNLNIMLIFMLLSMVEQKFWPKSSQLYRCEECCWWQKGQNLTKPKLGQKTTFQAIF